MEQSEGMQAGENHLKPFETIRNHLPAWPQPYNQLLEPRTVLQLQGPGAVFILELVFQSKKPEF